MLHGPKVSVIQIISQLTLIITYVTDTWKVSRSFTSRAGLRNGPAWQLYGAPTYKGRSAINGNMVLVNSGFPEAKEFVRKLSAVWARGLQMLASPVLGKKKFKEYPLEGEPN